MLRRELRQMTGVTLIELLVTLVIVSVGVLGVAGLQATSLQLTRDVNYKLTALQLAMMSLTACVSIEIKVMR